MANIPFKSITFPGLPNKYTVPEISNDLMTAGKAADAKATGDALSALEDQFSEETDKLKADLGALEAVTVDNLGENVVKTSDFTVASSGVTYTYNASEDSVTLSYASTTHTDYRVLTLPIDFLVGKLTVGKTYRLHYRADIISGNPAIMVGIKRANKTGVVPSLILPDGVAGYTDFVATAEISFLDLFITTTTEVGPCQVKYSEIYLCEVKEKTAVDSTARAGVDDVRSKLASTNVYKTMILGMLSSMTYNASEASSAMYKGLFSMIQSLKDSVSVFAFPAYTASGNKQGACTDGKYIYQCCGDVTSYTYMSIIKYDIETKAIVSTTTFNGTPNFGHANDMTYDPVTGYLYVAPVLQDGSVIRIDSKDMSYVDTITLLNGSGEPYNVWQIAFDRVTRHLISAVNTEYGIYDPDGTYIGAVPLASRISATAQGMETDGVYIYRVTYNPNCIDVCDMDGTRITTLSIPMTEEPETMMYDWMGTYYLTRYGASDGQFYIVDLME